MKNVLNLLGKILVFLMLTTGMLALLFGLLLFVSREMMLTIVGLFTMIAGILLISMYHEVADMLIDMEVKTDLEP